MKLFKKIMGFVLAVSMVMSSLGPISTQAAVLEDGGNELVKAAYAESWVEMDCSPMNLLDGDSSTQWHTLYQGMNEESETNHIPEDANGNESINNNNPMAKYNNLYLVLREPTTVENFFFQARWNANKNFVSNGAPHTLNIYVSDKNYEETKDIEWGEPVAKSPSGGFQYKSTKDLVQYVRFDEAQENVKTVRIEVTHSYNQNKSVDNKWIRMEEAGINMVLPEEKEYLPLPEEDPLYTIACMADIHIDYGIEHSDPPIRDTATTVINRVRQEENPNAIVVLGDTISANKKTSGGWYTGTDEEREAVYNNVLNTVYATLESGMENPKVMYVAGNHEPEVGMAAFNSQSFIEDGTERTMGEMVAATSPEDIYANAYFQDNMTGLLTNPEGERNVLAYHYNVDGIDYFGLNPPYVVRASTYAFDWGALEWVRNKMEAIGKDKTFIVLSHYPIGTDLTGGSTDNTNAETTAILKEMFAEFPKTIVLCGHIHTQYIEKDTAEGVVAYNADGVTRYMDTYSTPTGFINMFGGSQGYYGNMSGLVPQGALSATTPNYNQALMVYFYKDRICFQMKNYGAAGGELTPYTVMRSVDLDAAADKTLLDAIIGEVEALLKEIEAEDVKAKLEGALADAKAVQGAEDASQAQVNTAMTMLKKAVDESTEKAPEEEANYVDVDDAYETKTDELFKIKYLPEGKWTGEANHPEMFINATEHYTAKGTEQFSYEMKFIGTGLEIIATKRDTHANCDVYIDDVYVGDLIAYTDGEKVNQQVVFEIDGLENKEHILKVVKKADDAKAMQLDMIRVFYDELSASAITLDAKNVRVGIGGSKQVTANVEPWFVKAEVEWSSADETVATVDEKGMIKAVAQDLAETVITAKVKGTDLSAQVTVTVDPDLSKALVTVGDEKLLDIQKDYATLVEKEQILSWEGTAWKDDTINSKIMIAAKDTAVHNAEVTASDFVNEDGDVLKAENISIKWLKEVEAYNGKGTKRGELLAYPDIIHKGGAADVEAKTVKFAWVSINIPEDAKAGTYTGTITVKADEMKKPVELTYTVKVINLVQPELEAIDLQFWQHPFSVANYYLGLGSNVAIGSVCNETANDFYFTEKHFNLLRAEMEEYADIGGHDLVATIVEEAWNHQSFYGDPSMIKWTKNADGTWTYDYTWYDAWVEFAIECGIIDPENGIGRIKCYSIVPWGNYVSYYDEATSSTVKKAYTPGSADWIAIWTPFLEDFMAHSEEKGWFDITYISMDERTIAQLQPTVDLIESITNEDGEHFLISSCLNYSIAVDYNFTDRIDDISVGLKHIQAATANELSDHRREIGLNTTYYTCTGEYPSNFIISDPGDNYWTMWYTMTMGTDGYLRWAWDNYLYDMFGNVSYKSWEPGDCWFFYPVEREEVDMKGDCVAGFYSTPRYEMLKQGIRDVAKAKYLMAQSEEYYKTLDEVTGSIVRPKSGTVNGSTTYANQTERMLTHSETDRVYAAMSAIAEEYAATLEEKPVDPPVGPTTDPADDSKDIPVDMYTATAGSTQPGNSPDTALDENPGSFWEVVWDIGNTDPSVMWYQIELADEVEIDAVRYLPRWGGDAGNINGFVTQYLIQVSTDGENWTDAAEGTWERTEGWKIAEFEAVTAKYVRLTGVGTWADVGENSNMSIAEIRVRATGEVINKGALKAAIAKAENLVKEDYVDLSGIEAPLAAAKAVADKAEATQEEVDAAAAALNEALDALVKVVKKDALKAAIADAKAVDQSLYTSKTAKALANAIEAGEDLVDDETATQEVVDAATAAITKAKAALVAKATAEEKAALAEAVEAAEAMDTSAYTEESVAALDEAIAAAKAVLDDADATSKDVKDAADDLQDAVDALEIPVVEDEVVRLFGQGRYDTAYAVADALKEALGVEKFEAVVVATGKNFADALAGSYLAVEKNAPILLTNGNDENVAQLHAYIKANVAEGGKVYILGGDGAVPTTVDVIDGYEVERLFGDSRYDTNLAILEEAGVTGDSIIVATGKTFADSLSASAAKLPILLVKPDGTLNDAQKAILTGMKNIYIVGGDGAVSTAYEAELKEFGEVTRVFGESRYDTSVEVAKTFCKDVTKAVVASGKNFPDGLCGGPLAAALNAPLVLTKDGGTDAAAAYVAENGIAGGYVLGGDGALTDTTVVEVFALTGAEKIK